MCGKSLPFIIFTGTNPHYRHTTGTLQAHSGTHTQITKMDGFEFYK